MATAVEIEWPDSWTTASEQPFLLSDISWHGYEAMLQALGDRRVRATYDRGTLELMSPSAPHEEFGRLFDVLIQAVVEELDIPCLGLRSTTWRRRLKERGIEADECYYLAHAAHVLARGKTIDLEVDPPPDLCIEVEISRSAMDRMGIHAALDVPEVWRFDGETLRVCALQPDGQYAERDASPGLPFLPPGEVVRLLKLAEGIDHTRWGRLVRRWVRETLVPGHGPRGDAA